MEPDSTPRLRRLLPAAALVLCGLLPLPRAACTTEPVLDFDTAIATDPEMFEMMRAQVTAHPELGLGGPSYVWLHQALLECIDLSRQPSPNVPCLTFLGTNERIVDTKAVHDRMGRWPKARLEMIENAEHEVLMETPAIRARIFDTMSAHFVAAT